MVQPIIPPQLIPQRQLQWGRHTSGQNTSSSDQTLGLQTWVCACTSLHRMLLLVMAGPAHSELPPPTAATAHTPCCAKATLRCNSTDGQPAAAGTVQCLSISMQIDLHSPMRPTTPLLASLFGASAYLMGPPPPPRTGRADLACIKLRASALPPWRSAMAGKALVRLLQSYCSLRSCSARSSNETGWSAGPAGLS